MLEDQPFHACGESRQVLVRFGGQETQPSDRPANDDSGCCEQQAFRRSSGMHFKVLPDQYDVPFLSLSMGVGFWGWSEQAPRLSRLFGWPLLRLF